MVTADTQHCPNCGRTSAAGYRVCAWCSSPLPEGGPLSRIALGSQIDFGWATAVIEAQIGEGGMGVVYRAWMHPRGAGGVQPPFEAAVKVLLPMYSHATTEGARVRALFANEAQILASLAHPNVVRFLGLTDLQNDQGARAIAMELVHGETLQSLIDRKAEKAASERASRPGVRTLPCLPFDRAWHYFQQLLGALAATHAIGIIHRDVKPDNVLIRVDGVAKLTDFGIARTPSGVAKATGNMIAGTVAYMSPEQIQGHELDGRSDLYSAGVVLFEMLTGRLPFLADGRSEWLVACDHVQTPPPPLRSLLPQAPMELELLVARALAKSPNDRFGDAIAFGDSFRTTLGFRPDAGWQAQQDLASAAARFAQAHAVGIRNAGEAPDLVSARDAVASAYVGRRP